MSYERSEHSLALLQHRRWRKSMGDDLKVTIVSQLRILNGIEFQVVAAECLNAQDATDLG